MKLSAIRLQNGILITLLLGIICNIQCLAQYHEKPYRIPNTFFGLEASMGTKTFHIKSDIGAINGLKSIEEGFTIGLLAGGNLAQVKVRSGYFKPASAMTEKLTLRNYELHVNAFPLALTRSKTDFFKPYLTAGLDRTQLKFFGNYSLPKPPVTKLPPPPCDPDLVDTPPMEEPEAQRPAAELPEDTQLGTVTVVRGFAGSGLVIHVRTRNNFLNLFMEAQYGFMLSTKANKPEFDNTSVSGQIAYNAGIAIGIRR